MLKVWFYFIVIFIYFYFYRNYSLTMYASSLGERIMFRLLIKVFVSDFFCYTNLFTYLVFAFVLHIWILNYCFFLFSQFALGLLLSYPLAAILRGLPKSYHNTKHLFSMCTGLLLLRFVYGGGWIHGLVSTVVTYLICLVAPRWICIHLSFYAVFVYKAAIFL